MATAFVDLIFRGDASDVQKTTKQSQRDVKRYSFLVKRELNSLADSLKRSTAVAAAGIGALAVSSINLADEVTKSANNAGIAAREFQKLNFAYNRLGIDTEGLTSLSRDLSVRIVELREGAAGTTELFDRLGLSADSFGTNAAQNLRIFNNALRDVEDPIVRVATASDILGGDGERLASILELTGEEVDQLGQKFEDYGAVISDVARNKAKELQNRFEETRDVIRNNFANGLLETIDISEDFGDELQQLGMAAREFGMTIADGINFLVEHRETVQTLITAYVAYRIATSRLIEFIFKLAAAYRALAAAQATAIGTEAGGGVLGLIGRFRNLGGIIGRLALRLVPGIGIFLALDFLISKFFDTESIIDRVINKLKEFLGLSTTVATTATLRAEILLLEKQIALRDEQLGQLNEGTQAYKEYDNATQGLRDRLDDLQLELREMSIANVELKKTAKDTTDSMVDGINQVTNATNKATRATKRFSDSFLEAQRARRQDQEPTGLDIFNLRQATARGNRPPPPDDGRIDRDVCNVANDITNKLVPNLSRQQVGAINNLTDDYSTQLARSLVASLRGGDFSQAGNSLFGNLADHFAQIATHNLANRIRGGGSSSVLIAALLGAGALSFHNGGRVTGRPGGEVVGVLEVGENVQTQQQQRQQGGVTIVMNVMGNVDETVEQSLFRRIKSVTNAVFSQARLEQLV